MAGRSISISVAGEATITIDGYSRIKRLLKNGECVRSNPFNLGGQHWVVAYYPNGRYSSSGTMSVYLFLDLDSADAKDEVRGQVTYSLLYKNGEQVLSHNHARTEHTFRSDRDLYIDSITHQDLEELGLLEYDCFSISFHITVLKGSTTIQKSRQFLVVPPSNLHQHLGDLLSSTDGADVTFHVGGETFLAHRSVLAARSSVFKAELLGAMKENLGDPVKIDDMEACVFKSLLNFIYTDSLIWEDEGTDEDEKQQGDIVMASHLLVAADRYNIERLKLICEDKLCTHIDVNMVATSLALAEQHTCHVLKEACFHFLACPSNLEAMKASDGYEHLKTSCPSILKELISRLLPVEFNTAKDIIMDI